MKSPREAEHLKRAMFSVEITVERDRVTGETRVLSTNTKLPVDLSHQGVIVYEDEQKVVHEMNGEDGVQPLSSSEVEELIHKADEALMMSQSNAVVTSLPTAELEGETGPQAAPQVAPLVPVEAPGLGTRSAAGASEQKPVTMVFMGYQSVEDEDQTKNVLGLQEMVTAELVLVTDGPASPGEGKEELPLLPHPPEPLPVPPAVLSEPPVEPQQLRAGAAAELKKEKQLCVCCSVM